MISPEDESVFSGYLDGELDPIERRAVESALAADPCLAARVRDLVAVRELVGELSRPAAPDVSLEVLRRIQGTPARSGRWTSVRRNLPWLAGGLAAAAALFLVIVGAFQHRNRHAPGPLIGNQAAQGTPKPGPEHQPKLESTPPSQEVALERHESPSSPETGPKALEEPRTEAIPLAVGPPVAPEPPESTRWRSLIDDPRLRRVFLVTDQIGSPAERQVASMVERSTRHEFYKVTISQGIVVDPRHPDRAVVFAVVLDETQLPPFREGLEQEFKDRLQEHDVDPSVALQLADIGDVVSLPPHPDAKVIIPGDSVAMRTGDNPTVYQEHSKPVPGLPPSPPPEMPALDPARPSTPSGIHEGHTRPSRNVAVPSTRAPHPPLPRDSMRAEDHQLIVLIWITGTNSGS
jgi:hypothetical protein